MLLQQIDETIAQDKAAENDAIEFTPAALSRLARELKEALTAESAAGTKEEKKEHRAKQKEIKELEKHAHKLAEYDNHLQRLADRNSYSRTDPSATCMRMKRGCDE